MIICAIVCKLGFYLTEADFFVVPIHFFFQVVKRSSAQQETAPIMTWSRTARGSAYTGARFARVPFPRGVPGVFRPRLMVKPGARSMQWKRDAQVASAESGSSGAGNSGSIPTPRSLTYIRTEPKSEGVQVQHNLAI